jgi:Patatin-like phospholipase
MWKMLSRGRGPEELTKRHTLNQVLASEWTALRPKLTGIPEPAGYSATRENDREIQARAANLTELYTRIGKLGQEAGADSQQPLSALCLSGGGIRSATFNLGVIQGLARNGLLEKFDYLSSVSGGGYIASWLRTWMSRAGAKDVIQSLRGDGDAADPLAPEPPQIKCLREYSNYLTPRVGLFSADTWTAAAIILRNVLLNWLVMLPLLGAMIAVPQVLLVLVKSTNLPHTHACVWLAVALAAELTASTLLYYYRRFVKNPKVPQFRFVICCVAPVVLASALLAFAGLGLDLPWKQAEPEPTIADQKWLCVFAVVWCIGIPVLGWAINEIASRWHHRSNDAPKRVVSLPTEFIALIISGAVGAAILIELIIEWLPALYGNPGAYVVLSVPVLLSVYLIARAVFVAIASLGGSKQSTESKQHMGSSDDADREWWARLSGWILIFAMAWLILTALSLLGGHLPQLGDELSAAYRAAIAAVGGVSGLIAALLGHDEKTPAKEDSPGAEKTPSSPLRRWVLAIAVPVFAVSVLLLIGWGTGYLGEKVTGVQALLALESGPEARSQPFELRLAAYVSIVPAGLLLFALLLGFIVNVNRFSLHGMYRNRLVRAYLGASNPARRPDPFTGFALDDNLNLHRLWNGVATKPLPLINATLNLVSGENLGWQQRKAESFSMTPFFCGNYREGYRNSQLYGRGISVGTAVTISGAAANPNMGYASSPSIGFLLALFNARLGAWLGNTNEHGNATFDKAGPRHSAKPLLAELFGMTNRKGRHVNLSDGGHFDNLGLYEVVLRRCRHILICDAGQDGSYAFEDLGNAIRKIRIDFGIPVVFKDRIKILPGSNDSEEDEGLYCATAEILYKDVDGCEVENGWLVYFKPTLRGHGTDSIPYDVYSYSRQAKAFPHEPTSDQWFSESQFESYRMLGQHTIRQVSGARRTAENHFSDLQNLSFEQFFANVSSYIDKTKQAPT